MSELSERLVAAVQNVLPEAYDRALRGGIAPFFPTTNPEDWGIEARAAVVAVLRAIGDEDDKREGFWENGGFPGAHGLAAEIEAGR